MSSMKNGTVENGSSGGGILGHKNGRKRKQISVSFAEKDEEHTVTRTKLNPEEEMSSGIIDHTQVRHLKSMRRQQRQQKHTKAGDDDNDDEEDEIPAERLLDTQYDDDDENDDRTGGGAAGSNYYGTKKTFVGENMTTDSRNLQSSDLDDNIPIEPFNMEEERTDGTGYFDGDTYVFRRNDDENEDAWLEDVNQTAPQSSLEQKLNNSIAFANSLINPSSSKKKEATDRPIHLQSKEQCYLVIVSKLAHEKETVLQAIQRYGNLVRKMNKKKNKKQKASSNHKGTEMTTVAQQSLDILTECAQSCLMEYNDVSIYQRNKQYFEKEISSFAPKSCSNTITATTNGTASESKENDKATTKIQWEYMGNDTETNNKVQGPFTSQQMLSWIQAGYFVGANAVQVRQIVTTNNNVPDKSMSTNNETKTETKDQLSSMLKDLEDSDDEDETNDNDLEKNESNEPNITRGEWIQSDKVPFASYL